MNRDVAGLEEDDDDDEKEKRALRWRGAEGKWGGEGEEDVRGSICQAMSLVPAGCLLSRATASLPLIEYPALSVDGS
jgi:hypothetical protein